MREAGDRILGQLKRAFYARMEEVSFRSGAAVAGGVLTAAGVAITLAVVLGGHSDAAASAPASRAAVPSVAPPSPVPVSFSSSPPTPRPSRTTDPAAVAGAYQPPSADRASTTRHAATPTPGRTPTPRLRDPRSPAPPGLPPGWWGNGPPPWPLGLLRHHRRR